MYLFSFLAPSLLSAQSYELYNDEKYIDEVSEKISTWSNILSNEIKSDTYDTHIFEWGERKGLAFEYAETPSNPLDDYELIAEIGTFKSIGFECEYYTVYAKISLNEFKSTTGSVSASRGHDCAKEK